MLQTLAKVAIENLKRITDGGQVDGLVPFQENAHILLNLLDLLFICGEVEVRQGAMNRIRRWGDRSSWGHEDVHLYLDFGIVCIIYKYRIMN